MKNPNPEEFARQVLWKLAGIEAQLYMIQASTVTEASLKTDHPDKALELLSASWRAQKIANQTKLFAIAAKQAGLSPEAQSPPPDEPPTFQVPGSRI